MSKFYTTGNSEPTRLLFYKRNAYKRRMYDLGENNLVDFQYGEKVFYGRMDRQQRAVFLPANTPGVFKNLNNSKNPSSPMKALNFVVNNFEKLRLDMLKASKKGKFPSDDEHFANLSVYRAFESPLRKYENYQEIYINKLGSILRENEFNYVNMSQFLPRLMNIFENTLESSPITFPAFIKSNLNDIMSTGLAIEVADLKYSDDDEKIRLMSTPAWRYFVNACDSYGFMIDINCPWRIVADINSTIMIEECRKENSVSGEAIFAFIYQQAYGETLGELHPLLAEIYNVGRKPSFFVEEVCDGKTVRKLVNSQIYNPFMVLQEYSTNDLLRIYMILRFYEAGIKMSPVEAEKLINDTIKAISSKNGKKVYFSIFESIIAKTFDKIGSFGYDFNLERNLLRTARDERDTGVSL